MVYGWWGDPASMLNQLRRAQHQASGREPRASAAGVYPMVNIYDNGEAFLIRAEVPGINKDKLDITTKGNRVAIQGERTCDLNSTSVAFHRRERDMGVFHRVITLPEQVDPARTTANYRNGVLEVICPRSEAARTHKVAIS